jgi:hypothetical protein
MTTKLGRFKLGPAKTRDGGDAEILKIVPEQDRPLIGAFEDHDGVWLPMRFKQRTEEIQRALASLPKVTVEVLDE